jgi:two-component system alkaline phosphatase synthesis response regulator PhoP
MSTSILIIDDDENLGCTFSLLFKQAGYQVTVVTNIVDARYRLSSGSFDLVFLDLQLPGVSGITFLPEILFNFSNKPVLILAGYDEFDSAIQAVNLGARDYLIKPVDPDLILTRVEHILSEYKNPAHKVGAVEKPAHSPVNASYKEINYKTGRSVPSIDPSPTDPKRFLRCGKLTLDLHAGHVLLQSQYIPLSNEVFSYLVVLVRHYPEAISSDSLILEAEGLHAPIETARRIASKRIHELRKALEPDLRQPHYIITVRGYGYRLNA